MASAVAARARSNPLRAAIRLTGVVSLTFLMACAGRVRLTVTPVARRAAVTARWHQRWGRWCCWLLGIRVTVEGPPPPPGSFIVTNHMGYVDVVAVAASAPCLIVPKAEVYNSPGIGTILRMIRVPVVDREDARTLGPAAAQTAHLLNSGIPVCVFVEGTSSGGDGVLPFRTPFFQAPVTCGAPVAPAALRWSSPDPAVNVAEDIAYWKDHVLAPHLWRFAGLKGAAVRVRFTDAIPHDPARNRKQLATMARDAVVRAFEAE